MIFVVNFIESTAESPNLILQVPHAMKRPTADIVDDDIELMTTAVITIISVNEQIIDGSSFL